MLSLVPLISVIAHGPLMVMGANPPSMDSDAPAERAAGVSPPSSLDGEAASSRASASDSSTLVDAELHDIRLDHLLDKFDRQLSAVRGSRDQLAYALRIQMVHALLVCATSSYLKINLRFGSIDRCYIKNDEVNQGRNRLIAAVNWLKQRPGPQYLQNIIACYRSLFAAYDDVLSECCRREDEAQSSDAAENARECAELKKITAEDYHHYYSERHLGLLRTDLDIDDILAEPNNIRIVNALLLCKFYNELVEQSNQRMRALHDRCQRSAQIDCGALCQKMELCRNRFREIIGYVNMSQSDLRTGERAADLLSVGLDEALTHDVARGLDFAQIENVVEGVVDKYMEETKRECRAVEADGDEIQEDSSSEDDDRLLAAVENYGEDTESETDFTDAVESFVEAEDQQ
ncbi:hypothetical protein PAPHI01_1449 [Pancytospora philotis]|nr:hypothetical protein PAPHI01_1449 [Pancytospora philotis]